MNFIDDFGYELADEMYHSAQVQFGEIELNNNTINATGNGMYFDDVLFYVGSAMHGNSTATFGHFQINDNEIDAGGFGMFFDYFASWLAAYQMGDSAQVQFGGIEVNNNTINATGDGMYYSYPVLYDVGYEMYGNPTGNFLHFQINGNLIIAGGDGIYLQNMYGGSDYDAMNDNSSVVIGDVQVNNNGITCNGSGIYVNNSDLGVRAPFQGNSSLTMGNVTFKCNTITCNGSGYGIYFYLNNFWINLSDAATFTVGELLVDGNTISNAEYGIYVNDTDNFTISNNYVHDNDHGIHLNASSNTTVMYNMIVNNTAPVPDTGAHVDANSFYNELHWNCFINNSPQAMDDETTQTNNWTGNFWNDWVNGSGPYPIDGAANNNDSNPLEVCPAPNITAAKVAVDMNDQQLQPGDVICYTVWINNTGNVSSADNPGNEFEDPIPAYTTYINGSANASSGAIEYNESDNTIRWNGEIPANGSIELTFCVTVDANVSPGTNISNQGTVNYDSDRDRINNAQMLTDNPATTQPDDSTVLTIASAAPPPQVQEVPVLTPIGVLALLGMLSFVLALSVKKRRNGE
jgi:uncharacterized repeat protein (TIGR01451 family)